MSDEQSSYIIIHLWVFNHRVDLQLFQEVYVHVLLIAQKIALFFFIENDPYSVLFCCRSDMLQA